MKNNGRNGCLETTARLKSHTPRLKSGCWVYGGAVSLYHQASRRQGKPSNHSRLAFIDCPLISPYYHTVINVGTEFTAQAVMTLQHVYSLYAPTQHPHPLQSPDTPDPRKRQKRIPPPYPLLPSNVKRSRTCIIIKDNLIWQGMFKTSWWTCLFSKHPCFPTFRCRPTLVNILPQSPKNRSLYPLPTPAVGYCGLTF